MTHHIPTCFLHFHCLAGQCPDTCCRGWEIDLDQETLARYRAMPGPMGDRIRETLKVADGFTGFSLEGDRCPFLTRENLCALIINVGEEALSVTCREHPRFLEEYGQLRETCLSISCPEAARLLLGEDFRLHTTRDDVLPPEDEDLDKDLLRLLNVCRNHLFARIGHPENISLLLREAAAVQAAIDKKYFGVEASPMELPIPDLGDYLRAMEGMEFTDGRLPARLKQCTGNYDLPKLLEKYPVHSRRLLHYFIYRYVLRAVWNGDLVDKVLFALCSTGAILALSETMPGENPITDAAVLYGREVEHSDENLSLLLTYLIGICG